MTSDPSKTFAELMSQTPFTPTPEEAGEEARDEAEGGTLTRVACVTDRGVTPKYWSRMSCYEMSSFDLSAKPAALRRWKELAPPEASFIARVDPQLALLGFKGPEAERLWGHALKRVEALGATALLLNTPSTFRPSVEACAAIERFFKETPLPCPVAWRADGLWEESDRYLEVCDAAGLMPVIDPLMWEEGAEMPEGERFYWRLLGGQGLTPRVTEYELERLLDLVEERGGDGWVVFSSPLMEPEAKRFSQLLRGE